MFASFPFSLLKLFIKVLNWISSVCICDYVCNFVECALFFLIQRFISFETFFSFRLNRSITAKSKLVFRTNEIDTLLHFYSFDGNKKKIHRNDTQNKNEQLTML